MIIDAHNHPDWYGMSLPAFLDNMKSCGIDKTWLLSWESPPDEYNPDYIAVTPDYGPRGPISFERCAMYAEKHPDKFILGYAPDPRRPEAIDLLKHAIALHGVRVYGEIKLRMMYDNPDALRMFRFCGEAGLPVVVHIDYEFDTGRTYPRPNWWYGGGIDAFERAVKACPETVFLGHAPGFWAHLSGDDQYDKVPYPSGKIEPDGKVLEMLEKYPNLYCDISAGSGLRAFERDREFAKQFITRYQDRILYGRDDFHNNHQQFLNSLDLPKSVLDKLYYMNANKLLRLEE